MTGGRGEFVIGETDLNLSKLRERLNLVNQAILTLENLASMEKLDPSEHGQSAFGSPAQARSGSNSAGARQNGSQHRKRVGQQRQR